MRSPVLTPASAVSSAILVVTGARGAGTPTLTPQVSGTTNRLQAVSPVSPMVVWASGLCGTYAVTTDGGG